ncbi:hypothetical protein [Streptomyces sp. NPDC051994]|uniref:hypothetical protein n=1 Tax=unclassified Streptomyces TaxID=2593676 RepID=UPI003420BCFF
MRFRAPVAAALGALALVITLPTSANAVGGEFVYSYSGPHGHVREARLKHPHGRECINLREVTGRHASSPARSPRNRTDAKATVFTDMHCKGAHFSLRPHGGHASDKLKFRSVIFR